MAITPAQLKASGGGRLEPAIMFAEEDGATLDARLQLYIDEGEAEAAAAGLTDPTEIDVAAKAWAYFRAFDAIYLRLSANPSSVALNDQGSASFLVTQIENFKTLRDEARAEFDEAVATPPPSSDTGWNLSQSFRH